jgi:hypothetical protein
VVALFAATPLVGLLVSALGAVPVVVLGFTLLGTGLDMACDGLFGLVLKAWSLRCSQPFKASAVVMVASAAIPNPY